ncbi:MAG: YcaO-like family protein [Desulfovibrio sp.]|nr:YcaO-like family protein [Desulfovibrio sp.]
MPEPQHIDYTYAHSQTQATTGYFSCEPPASLGEEEAFALLEKSPLDDFLHQHLLRLCSKKSSDELAALAALAYDPVQDCFLRPALAGILLECSLLLPTLATVCASFPADAAARLAVSSPAIHLRAAQQADWQTAAGWSALFGENICAHHPLPRADEADLPLLFPLEESLALGQHLADSSSLLSQIHAQVRAEGHPVQERRPAQETFLCALDALMENGIIAGPEMRHEASLSPIALLRAWQVDIAVHNGGLSHSLRGQATAYGRGLSLAQARASYAMEIVERASAYVSIADEQVCQRKTPLPLLRARYDELVTAGRAVLDPALLPLEAPCPDAPLHWLTAYAPDGSSVLVPAQAVFLFCNLDEPGIFLAGGSTGLASGNTLDEAKQAALTEIIERDAECTTPFSRTRCFTLASRDERVQALLDDYAARGIRVQFQDITTEFGLPVYQCFVTGHDGTVARATGASLSGPRAALAALTETPWPYVWAQPAPFGKASGPGLAALPTRCLEDLPGYDLGSAAANVRLMELLLSAHGRQPLYVDLTRADLDLPVVRAIVPGLELNAEWDSFSRPSRRLFGRYARMLS